MATSVDTESDDAAGDTSALSARSHAPSSNELRTLFATTRETPPRAGVVAITEPYDSYRSLELRTECYRRCTRPTRSGPLANDNKAGYIALLRAFDMKRNHQPQRVAIDPSLDHVGRTRAASVALGHQVQAPAAENTRPHDIHTASRKRAHLSDQDAEDRDVPSRGGIVAYAEEVMSADSRVEADARGLSSRRSRSIARAARALQSGNVGRAIVDSVQPLAVATVEATGPETTAASGRSSPLPVNAVPGISALTSHQIKADYVHLKMQLLVEAREHEKATRRDEQRSRLHADLRGVIATLAKLRRLAKEYELDTAVVAEVRQDLAFFQDQKRKLKLELELLDRFT